MKHRMLLNISMREKKLSVGKGEAVLFPDTPSVIGFPWFKNINPKFKDTISTNNMMSDPFYIDNPLNRYNLDRNIRLKSS